MKHSISNSFRFRLMVSFLAVSLIPLCLCSALLVKISSVHMNQSTKQAMQEQSLVLTEALDELSRAVSDASVMLQGNPTLTHALLADSTQNTQVYTALYEATEPIRDVCTLHLYNLRGEPLYSSHNPPHPQALNPHWGVLNQAFQNPGSPVYMTETTVSSGESMLLRAAILLKSEEIPMGFLVMEMDQGQIHQLLSQSSANQSVILLLNSFWRPIYSSRQDLLPELSESLRAELLTGSTPGEGTPDYLYTITQHQPTGLILVLQRPQAFGSETFRILYIISSCWALICIVISVLISLPLSRQISSPIRQLQQAFAQLECDDMSVHLSVRRTDDLGQLAIAFNHMVEALRSNRQELVENQKELDETRLRMLQAQLNPHFLGNTLDTMKWISKINKVPQVALMSTDLADILRFCISDEDFVPLRQELEILERYIEIQRIRLSDSFTFCVDIGEDLKDLPIPKMILQPIVENAILHGLAGVENSHIRIDAQIHQGTHLRITVTDNGWGIPAEMVGKAYSRDLLPGKNHLGLYNVHMILKLHYGADSGLFLDRGADGTGTAVTAMVPLHRTKEEY